MPPIQSPQSQAIETANGYLTAATQLLALYAELKDLGAKWTDEAVANTLSQLHTVSVNLDGSLAVVKDLNITTTNPINPLEFPSLSRPVSVFQLSQLKTILDGVVNYVEGQGVSTQPGARAILHNVTGG